MRIQYLLCYDIGNARRLRHALQLARAYSVGGQKSCHEVWLTRSERQQLLGDLEQLLDPKTDRAHLFQLDPRMTVRLLGQARHEPRLKAFMVL